MGPMMMDTTITSPAQNVTLTNTGWHVVTLDDLLPDWGEGPTRVEAIADLARSLRELYRWLRDEPDERLAPHLREQRDFLALFMGRLTEVV